jgi:hypothetical protein
MMPTETQPPQVRQGSIQNTIFALLCGGFIVNGIVITFIAPILPIFMAKWGLDDSRAGLFSPPARWFPPRGSSPPSSSAWPC